MNRLLFCVVLLFTPALFQGCTMLGPDYNEPHVEWLDTYQTDLYGQAQPAVAGQDDLRFWWQIFQDPTLNRLIEIARKNNPDLRIAGLRIIESRALLGISIGSRFPQLQQATGGLVRIDSWQTEGKNSGQHNDLTEYNLGFNIGWELDFWGRFRRGIESADAAYFASIATQQNLQVLLSSQVAQTYYAYRTTEKQIEIAQMNADLQKRSLEITKRLYESGQAAELDWQQAQTQYLATLSAIPNLEINLQQISNALGVLLGKPPGGLKELEGSIAELPSMDPQVIRSVPANLLMRRPDIRTAAWQVAAQSAQIGVAEADLYPSISLLGNLGWSGDSLDSSIDTLALGIGPNFTWNLFNYGRIKNNVRVQDARLQQALEAYQNTVLQAARELDDAAISVVKTREQGTILSHALKAAQRSLELSSSRYQEGYSAFQRVLDSQRALAAQSANFVSNQGAHINSVIAFYKALGGGWQPASTEDIVPEDMRRVMEERTDWGDMLQMSLPESKNDVEGQVNE